MTPEGYLTVGEIAERWQTHKRTVRRVVLAAGFEPDGFTGITPMFTAKNVERLERLRLQRQKATHRRRIEDGRRGALKRWHGIEPDSADGVITVAEAKRRAGRRRK